MILETALTVLHDDVLDKSLLLVKRVEKLHKLDDICLSLEQAHHFVLTRDDVASLLSSLDGHFYVSVQIKGLKDKTCVFKLEVLADAISLKMCGYSVVNYVLDLPKAPLPITLTGFKLGIWLEDTS